MHVHTHSRPCTLTRTCTRARAHPAPPQNWAEGRTQTAGYAARKFVQLSVGGPLVGLAFGLATTLWMRFMFNDDMAEVRVGSRV